MTIAIATPTGNTGASIAQQLIEAGADISVLVRDPDKLNDVICRHAIVFQGSLDDREFVVRATQGAKALYWLTPNNFGSSNFRAWQRQVGEAAAAAVQANQIPHVVNLSSTGAHLPDGMGPISGLHDVEQMFDRVAPNLIHLRPGFFMENYLTQLHSIESANSVFLPVSGERRLAMTATQDIAAVATQLLLHRDWSGQSIVGIHGPTDLSFDEAAAILSQSLNRSITHVQTTLDQLRESLLQHGASENVAAEYVQMWAKLADPSYASAEPRTSKTTTPTSFAQFVQQKMLPLLKADAANAVA